MGKCKENRGNIEINELVEEWGNIMNKIGMETLGTVNSRRNISKLDPTIKKAMQRRAISKK